MALRAVSANCSLVPKALSLYHPRVAVSALMPAYNAVCFRYSSGKSGKKKGNSNSTSGREGCKKEEGPRCGEALAKSPCMEAKKKEKKKTKEEKAPSMWANPDCCKEPCPDILPRFDELYYMPSDKLKRKYFQTWIECPELRVVKKPICCFDKLGFPPIKRRKHKAKPKTACSTSKKDNLLMSCRDKKTSKCVKITMPGCKGSRDPPKCKSIRGPSHCKKRCAPYPSFSECRRDPPRPLHPVECKCLNLISMCEVWAMLRKMQGKC